MNRTVTAQNIVLLDALRQIIQALYAAGVSPLILKGAALAETVYPSIAVRAMVDLDILIHEDETEKTGTCLTGLGYSPQEHEDFVFCKTVRFPVRIDVHDKIWYLPDAAFRQLWHQSLPLSISGAEGRMMPVDELLIYTAAHAAIQHGMLDRVALEDINHICRFYQPTMKWDHVVTKVKDYHLQVPLHLVFAAARRSTGAPIPDTVLDGLKPSSFPQRVDAMIYRSVFRAPPLMNVGHLLRVLSQRGLWGKVRFLVHFVFPSRAFIARRYQVSAPIAILGYHLARPMLLAIEGVKLMFRWIAAFVRRWCHPGNA